MSKPNDGGPAFPVTYEDGMAEKFSVGMSLRDYFAAKVAQSTARQIIEDFDKGDRAMVEALEVIAAVSYNVADAMIAERERRQEKESK